MHVRREIVFILILLQINETVSQCSNNQTYGNDPITALNNRDPQTGVAIMMRHGEYQFQCCGFIFMWEFHVASSYAVPGSFYGQVWRGGWPGGGSGTNPFQSTLVGSNILTADVLGFDNQTIPNGQRIRCLKNDYIGIHSTGSFPLSYNTTSSSHDRLKLTNVLTTMSSPYTWSGYSNQPQDYAINAHVTPGKAPTINPISDITYYNDQLSVGMYIVTVTSADEDIEDQNSTTVSVQWISNSGTNYYQFNGADNFTLKAMPPFNTYTVTMKAQDICSLSSTSSFKIIILNRLPVINNLPSTISIVEDTAGNAWVFNVNATDTVSDPVNCSVIGAYTNTFTVKTPNDVYTKSSVVFNYDTQTTYAVTIRCTDGTDSVDGVLTVNLIRNNPPVIYSLPASISFSEDLAVRTLLHSLYVNDTEGDTINCTLNPTSSTFDVSYIPSSTTDYGIFLTGGKILDYDITPSYLLQVQCADRRRSTKGNYTVTLIKNMPPTILNLPMSCEIPEETLKETLIYSVSVTDPTNDTVTCSILTTTSIFYILMSANQFQYDIYVRSSPGFNYDTLRSFKLNISCADQRRSDLDYFYVYLIRNQPPKFTNLQDKTTLSSTKSTVGSLVFTVKAYDRENDQLQYSITAPVNGPFTINQNTGVISLTRSIMMDAITGYDLSINVSDGRNTVGPNKLTVLITDINSPPVFRNLQQTVSLLEGITVGTVAFIPQVEDQNHMDVHSFTVSYNPPGGAVYFAINKTDGSIITLAAIDYETITYKTFFLTLTVTDGFMTDTGNLTINILNVNEAPTFTKKSYMFSAAEGAGGTVLQNPYYQCSDPDGDTLMFSFDCGASTGRLNMNKTNGFLSYAVKYDLDVTGTPSNLLCQVYASDGSYTDTANLNITIIDANDNSPVFQQAEYTFFVLAKTAVGIKIGQVDAKDADVGRYGTFIYYIEQENIAYSLFKVYNNGGLYLIAPLTGYTEKSILRFIIYAVDVGGLDASTNVTVVIPDTSVPPVASEDTILYRSFFSYAPNMAWFVPALFAVFGAVCVIIYTIGKAVAEREPPKRKHKPRTRRTFPLQRPPRR